MNTTGFFVDWNGDTRRVEAPGEGLSCSPAIEKGVAPNAFLAVDVIDSAGFVVHEAVYYPSIQTLEAAGVNVHLVCA